MEFRYQTDKSRQNTVGSSFFSKGLLESQANGAGQKCFNQGSKQPTVLMNKRQRVLQDLNMQDNQDELFLREIAFKICMDEEIKIEKALRKQLADLYAGTNNLGKMINFDIGLGLKDSSSPSIKAPSFNGISDSLLFGKHSVSDCAAKNAPPVRKASQIQSLTRFKDPLLLSGKHSVSYSVTKNIPEPSSVRNDFAESNGVPTQFNACANDFSTPTQGYNTSVSDDFDELIPIHEASYASDLRELNEPFTPSDPTGSENKLSRSADDHDTSDFLELDEEMPQQVSSKPAESENKASDSAECFDKPSALQVQSKPTGCENKLSPTLPAEPKDESNKDDKSASSPEEDYKQELTRDKEEASAAITWSCSLCKDFKGTSSKDVFDEHLKSMLHKANEYNYKVKQQSTFSTDILTAKEPDNPPLVKEKEKCQTKRAMKPRSSILKKAKVHSD